MLNRALHDAVDWGLIPTIYPYIDDQHEEDDIGRNSSPIPVPRQTVIHHREPVDAVGQPADDQAQAGAGKTFGFALTPSRCLSEIPA